MKTIAVVCEKGGTGKSMVANELYEGFKRAAKSVSMYSLDGQYRDNASNKKVENAEVAIVDTPGVLTDNLKNIIEGSDLVVIPVRPTPNDIEPFTRTVSIVEKLTDAPYLIVVNGWNRFRMCSSFMGWLNSKEWAKHVLCVPQSEAIVQAEGLEKSVLEVDKHGSAAAAMRVLLDTVNLLINVLYK